MNQQKHKSIRLTQGVKRIQNYLFQFLDLLGKGNFSSVYKGINELTNETVAIKYIALSSLTCERLKELLDQEIQILTSLNHPNIVKCFEVLKSSNNCYIITELCDGGDLEGILKKKNFLSEDEMIPYVRDIFEGLYYLSKKNIVHRDVKIANIFLSKGKAKIADFGFAQRSKQDLDQNIRKQFNDGKIGTPLCMSPQGFLQNLYGCKTDVWAFGIILYQLAHGRLPLEHCTTEEMLRHQIQIQITIDQLRPQLSIELKDLIIKCLDVNPCTRNTFQEIKNSPFIRKITTNRVSMFSLTNLRCIPSCHVNQEEGSQSEPFIVSLKNLNLPQFNHLNQNEKVQVSKKNSHFNVPYGTNLICEDMKPQKTKQMFQKENKCICKPAKVQIPTTIKYIQVKNISSQQDIQVKNIISDSSNQNEEFTITISHKSFQNLPTIKEDFLNTAEKEKLIISTTDRDSSEQQNSSLNPLTVPAFKRHKGSFELTVAESKQIQQIYQNSNTRPVSSRQGNERQQNVKIHETDMGKKEKNSIEFCPVTNTKRLLSGFIKFNEAIGLIHFCRLIYKYISELKATGIYHVGDLNLRYYSNYLLNLMNELVNKICTDHIILTKASKEEEGKQNKLSKMKKVIEEYIERYKPQLEKERAEYLNRTTGQIKQIAILDQRFIETFYIPDKGKLQSYNVKMVKFSEILQKCSRYQRYSQFDSNKELEELSKEVKKEENKERVVFSEKFLQNVQSPQKVFKVDTSHKNIDVSSKHISLKLLQSQPSVV